MQTGQDWVIELQGKKNMVESDTYLQGMKQILVLSQAEYWILGLW